MENSIPIIGSGMRAFTPKSKKAPGACIDCKFSSHEGADLVCRRLPPTASILQMPGRVAGTVTTTTASVFAPIKPDMWCGEFAASVVDAVPAVPFERGPQ